MEDFWLFLLRVLCAVTVIGLIVLIVCVCVLAVTLIIDCIRGH